MKNSITISGSQAAIVFSFGSVRTIMGPFSVKPQNVETLTQYSEG